MPLPQPSDPPTARAGVRRDGPAGRAAAVLTIAAALVAALLLAGCAEPAATSFDPAAPCAGAARQQMPGAYPDLEARVPRQLDGRAAGSRDSGRFCAKETLGSVYDAGVAEVRFGGSIWEVGERGGVQMAVFEGAGLTPELYAAEYRRAAEQDRATEAVKATTLEVDGRPAWRIDVVNSNSRQAIVVWGSADGAVVQVVVAADVDEAQLQAAIAAFA
jgi:hypothetical protein